MKIVMYTIEKKIAMYNVLLWSLWFFQSGLILIKKTGGSNNSSTFDLQKISTKQNSI
jgi:hypothetical protein